MTLRWLLLVLFVLTTAYGNGQMKRYDTDFFVSERDFLMAVPLEVERGQLYVTLDFNGRLCRFKLRESCMTMFSCQGSELSAL